VIFDWLDIGWKYEPQRFGLSNSSRYFSDSLLPGFEAIVCSVGEDDTSFLYPYRDGQPMESNAVNVLSCITAHNFRNPVYAWKRKTRWA